jgi:hypothetical protein
VISHCANYQILHGGARTNLVKLGSYHSTKHSHIGVNDVTYTYILM